MSRSTRAEDARPLSTRRLEAFTDGVFAIAATLLVLDLSIGNADTIKTSQDLWAAILKMQDSLISFAISFLILGMFWLIHVRQFEYLQRVDTILTWLNLVRLLGVVLIPFSASVNAEFNDMVLGVVLLPANFLFVTILGAWQWLYATSPGRGLVEGISPEGIRVGRLHSYVVVGFSIAIVILSIFVGGWAFALFVFNPLVDRLIERMKIFGTPKEGPDDRPQPG